MEHAVGPKSGRGRAGAPTGVPNRVFYNPPRREDFPPRPSNWRDGLHNVLSSVESNRADHPIAVFKNEKYVCTYDMYPKARYHLLLMRRRCGQRAEGLGLVRTLDDLEPSDLREVREFHALGRNIASRLEEFHENERPNKGSRIKMRLGYHAVPSFDPLHLHIISSDLDSPCIAKRHHITSFTSIFFVSADSLERHLESAFADSIRLSVRKERALSIKRTTPMTCPGCGREALSVPDWKRHNHICEATPPKEETDRGKLNSLLGWVRKVDPEEESRGAGPTAATIVTHVESRKRSATAASGDIEPVTPENFTVSGCRTRYIVYMAIRERENSTFARGLALCKDACGFELQHCLQLNGTRHVTMYDGRLSRDEVRSLAFRGRFAPLEMALDGWKPWDAGAYLSLSERGESDLKKLLNKIDGLPYFEGDGKVKCNHLSLYRRRRVTTVPDLLVKTEFRRIREATQSHSWGHVEGVSLRVKAYGAPYSECKVLADAEQSCTQTMHASANGKKSKATKG